MKILPRKIAEPFKNYKNCQYDDLIDNIVKDVTRENTHIILKIVKVK